MKIARSRFPGHLKRNIFLLKICTKLLGKMQKSAMSIPSVVLGAIEWVSSFIQPSFVSRFIRYGSLQISPREHNDSKIRLPTYFLLMSQLTLQLLNDRSSTFLTRLLQDISISLWVTSINVPVWPCFTIWSMVDHHPQKYWHFFQNLFHFWKISMDGRWTELTNEKTNGPINPKSF